MSNKELRMLKEHCPINMFIIRYSLFDIPNSTHEHTTLLESVENPSGLEIDSLASSCTPKYTYERYEISHPLRYSFLMNRSASVLLVTSNFSGFHSSRSPTR